jgi:hypothetical protein
MSVINFIEIERNIDTFVIGVVNLFTDKRIDTFKSAIKIINEKLISNPDSFTDYHDNLEHIIGNLIFLVSQEDTVGFVTFILCVTHLAEVTIKLDEAIDFEKVQIITELSGELYRSVEIYNQENI